MEGANVNNGHEYGFVHAGATVYCASVFVANFWLLMRFHQHDIVSNVFFLLMFLSGHCLYWLISVVFANFEIYGEFYSQFDWLIWLTYLISGLYMVVYEMGRRSFEEILYEVKGVKSLEIKQEKPQETELGAIDTKI